MLTALLHRIFISKKELSKNEIGQALLKVGKGAQTRFPYLNSGGCCVFASLVGKELQLRGITVNGIVAHHRGKGNSISKARKNIQASTPSITQWAQNSVEMGHVGLEFKLNGIKVHYDSTGLWHADTELDSMPIYKGRLSVDEMTAVAESSDGWNECFDRDDIPKLKLLVKRSFRHIDIIPI